MQTVNIHDARTHFSMLVDAAANGEEITITKAGKPVARLGPIQGDRAPRRFGGLKGRVSVRSRLNRLPFDQEELAPSENKPSRIKAPGMVSLDSVRTPALLYLAAVRIDKDQII